MNYSIPALTLLLTSVMVGCGSETDSNAVHISVPVLQSAQCIGTWHCETVHSATGEPLIIQWQPRADGTCTYTFLHDGQPISTQQSTWQLSKGKLYETLENGVQAEGYLEFVDADAFRLTIIDNGVPASSGEVRIYRRV